MAAWHPAFESIVCRNLFVLFGLATTDARGVMRRGPINRARV